jgi:hypothetical protein
MSATPASYRTPPPALDQDGAAVRRWLLDGAAADGAGAQATSGRPR